MAGACEKDKHEMESTDQGSGYSHPDFTNYERSFKFTSLQVSALGFICGLKWMETDTHGRTRMDTNYL